MDLSTAKRLIKFLWKIKASNKIKNLPVVTLVGDTGIGKSTALNEVVAELEKEGAFKNNNLKPYCESLFLAQQEVGDLIGNIETSKDGRTTWTKPDWFPYEHHAGILILDELADANEDNRRAIMPLFLTGKLHQHKLPDNIMIVAAMNPIGGQFGGIAFTKQFRNRNAFIKIKPTVDEWAIYCRKNENMPEYAFNMAFQYPDVFDHKTSESDTWANEAMYDGIPSNRAITVAIQLYEAMTDVEKDAFGNELLISMVGSGATSRIITYRNQKEEDRLPGAEELLNPDTHNKVMDKLLGWNKDNEVFKISAFSNVVVSYILSKNTLSDVKMNLFIKYLSTVSIDIFGSILKTIQQHAIAYPDHAVYASKLIQEASLEYPDRFSKINNLINT